MRRLLASLLCLGAIACALHTAPTTAPHAPLTSPAGTRYGITDGGYTGVPFNILGAYCDAGRVVVRSPARSVDEARAIVESERPCNSTETHLLIEALQENDPLPAAIGAYAAHEPRVTRIECGNELELAPQKLAVDVAARRVGQCTRDLRLAGYTGVILTAAIYTVDGDQIVRLKAYHAACPTCSCTLHWYASDVSQWKIELDKIGCPDYAITEFGIPSVTPAEDAAQTIYYREELQGFWALGHVSLIESYQRASGPSSTNLDNFGQWRLNDTPKPVWTELYRLLFSLP